MRKHHIVRRRVAVVAAAAVAVGGCADDANELAGTPRRSAAPVPTTDVAATEAPGGELDRTTLAGDEVGDPAAAPEADATMATDGLSEDDLAGLLWIREEEQLAHDVYVVLGESWGLRIFDNIARSETGHVAAMLDLFGRLGVDDPAAGNELGTFTDPAMQELYDDFVEQGSRSLIDALRVGATIEELDIVDLGLRAEATDLAAIERVYERLARGSRNHLRAFHSQLEARDAAYRPTALDETTFESIVSGPRERGGRGA